jgi:SulP family sulfate permease
MTSLVERVKLPRLGWRRRDVSDDARAAMVLGVESVPDGLASGLLAGVNPVAGLYAYMFGAASGALFTGTVFMAIQGTGAMAIIIDDVDLDSSDDPTRALVTLSVMTGIVMLLAGFLKLGGLMRFVSNSVMVGFISAVGVNIMLGQVGDLTGYYSDGANRITRTLDTLFHPWLIDVWTLIVGLVTIVLILLLRETKLGAMGLVVAIIVGSALASLFRALGHDVQLVGNVANIPDSLPAPTLPLLGESFSLVIPALSLAFVGLIQGAGVSAAFTNPDGSQVDQSKDFVGQGVGNLVAGTFQGMPVGGSMSASSLISSAGARSRWALVYTGVVMGVVILFFGGIVEYIAMPALAGLLMVVGAQTVKLHDLKSVYKTGSIQAVVMIVTFALTLLIPLQYAVLVGVGISMILYIIRQSNQLDMRRLFVNEDGGVDEVDPPEEVGTHDVVVLQPYGSLFFAAAPMFEAQLPAVTEHSGGSVVILRFRGKPEVGSTLIDVLKRYSVSLDEVGSKLMIVTDSERIIDQFDRTGATAQLGEENLYRGGIRLMATVIRATGDAQQWVEEAAGDGHTSLDRGPTIADLTLEATPDDDTSHDESPEDDTADADSDEGDGGELDDEAARGDRDAD